MMAGESLKEIGVTLTLLERKRGLQGEACTTQWLSKCKGIKNCIYERHAMMHSLQNWRVRQAVEEDEGGFFYT